MSRPHVALLALAVLVASCGDDAPGSVPSTEPTPALDTPPGFVYFPGGPAQPMGMSVKALRAFIDEDLEKEPRKQANWENYWKGGLLYSTPDMKVDIEPFWLARHEVTNAQWRVFLENPRNLKTVTDSSPWEIGEIAASLYGVDEDSDRLAFQQAWLSIYHRNRETLDRVFNSEGSADFDVLAARAKWSATQDPKDALIVPAGTPITYAIVPPPHRKVGFDADGTVVTETIDARDEAGAVIATRKERKHRHPVHYVSWEDALRFCLWAGLHIPLEREWANAARGAEGRRFAWGDEWTTAHAAFRGNAVYTGTLAVDEGSGFESPEGLRHLAGNVNEWVLEPMRLYPGVDEAATPYDRAGFGVLARGGFFGSRSFTMLAADRIWDAGDVLGTKQRIDGFGLRPAAYSLPMKDYAVLVALNFNDTSGHGPWEYAPPPAFLAEVQREHPETWRADPRRRTPQLLALEPERTAGWMKRQVQDDSRGDHVYVTGAAQGIGFLPIRAMLGGGFAGLHDAESLVRLARDEQQIAFVGVLIGTENATLLLENASAEPVELSFADDRLHARAKRLDHDYPLGAFVVLRGERVAIYPWSGESVGPWGAHMAARHEPLGYLPTGRKPSENAPAPPSWTVTWEGVEGVTPSATRVGEDFTLTTLIPAMTDEGEPRLNATDRGAILTLHLRASLSDE